MNPFWVPEKCLCPHPPDWKILNLTSLSGTFIVLLKLYFLFLQFLNWRQFVLFSLSFPLIGYCVNKSNAVFKLKQGKEPWTLEVEFPRQNYPGEWEIIALVISSEVVGALCFLKYFFNNLFLKCSILLEMNEYNWSAHVSNVNHTSIFILSTKIPPFAQHFYRLTSLSYILKLT